MLDTVLKSNIIANNLLWRKTVGDLEKKGEINISNLKGEYRGWFFSLILGKRKKILLLCNDQILARKWLEDLDDWSVKSVLLPCSWNQLSRAELLDVSKKLYDISCSGGVVIASIEEWEKGWSFDWKTEFVVKKGDEYSYKDFTLRLNDSEYLRSKKISNRGEYTILGDSCIIWPWLKDEFYRLEFDNTRIGAIKLIDGSTGEIKNELEELLLGGNLKRVDEDTAIASLLEKINFQGLVFGEVDFEEKKRILSKHRNKFVNIYNLFNLDDSLQTNMLKWPINSFGPWVGGRDNFLSVIKKMNLDANLLVTSNNKEVRNWILEEKSVKTKTEYLDTQIPVGGYLIDKSLGIWSDKELFGRAAKKQKTRELNKVSFKKLAEYKIGDLVVHADHGIGLLKDFTTRQISGISKDYLVVAYSKGDLLYVPIEQLNKLSKYIGSKLVKLNRLGSSLWFKKKSRAKKQVEEMAKELLRLYAARRLVRRSPYRLFSDSAKKLEESFSFELTSDQKQTLREIDNDLTNDYPMDRLLCGDVGFGKTELALRAAARIALSKTQIAVMVPTTILAEQHFVTFTQRLSGLGLKVAVISRLRDDKYQKNVIKDLALGKIDVLIGTHRLLQKDVIFKKLGLLVIDEEQKFGVRAKEKLKELKETVDILSMSATPIPRSLNMSMGGIRDLSILEVAPEGRRSINTEVIPYSDDVVREAVIREVSRGGQVFIIHNRVRTIAQMKEHLSNLLGDKVRIGIAHGKMSERDLAETMNSFASGNYDVLLATTIVENGLDLPNVNTLIVENAAGLGLSQLYQLRGRVGRSNRKAYAYFLYKSEKLKLKAKQRLQAISEAKELGSGMKLAVADMEIRGVGNVLGVQQHGNAYAIGLGMFLDMLNDMVEQLKNNISSDASLSDEQVTIDLPISCAIPTYYIPEREERLFWEQKISVQSDLSHIDELSSQMFDKYGSLPESVENYFGIVKMRLMAKLLGIKYIYFKKNKLLSGYEENNIIIGFNEEIGLNWVQYLFTEANNWIFKSKEAIIDIKLLKVQNWFKWLSKIILKAQEKIN